MKTIIGFVKNLKSDLMSSITDSNIHSTSIKLVIIFSIYNFITNFNLYKFMLSFIKNRGPIAFILLTLIYFNYITGTDAQYIMRIYVLGLIGLSFVKVPLKINNLVYWFISLLLGCFVLCLILKIFVYFILSSLILLE